ncbi:DUF2007 domain-containing protein [Prolixibacteraceae bacterium Z1-6]|uniref:DUF2007 domain-containing protein n=1 Tax=Draconibacterium aestuarii TaxID=2998507 RepID=A0A9X3F6Z0_9BACT|nr:DUF2007 domain-containing protein [Prolixibacteraceae bacterium Z1-6]
MAGNDELVKLYTGGDVIITRIKLELEAQGIKSLIKDGFKQGIEAGFGGGVPSAIDIFVTEKNFEKARKLVKAITEE